MGRAPCCDKENVKRGPWSPEEDAALRSYVERHGTGGNWIALPQKAGLKRCGKSCRLRWLNYLRPDIKHGGFTEEEDNIICTLYKTIGSRWSVIVSHLPGRTDNDVKNYWNTKLKKRVMAGETNPPNTILPTPIHHIHSPSPPTPPPPPPPPPSFISAVKAETYTYDNFIVLPERTLDNSGLGSPTGLLPSLPEFPSLGNTDEFNIFMAEDLSATSSSVSMENSSSYNNYFNWNYGGASLDDVLFRDSGFRSFSELVCGCGSSENMVEAAPPFCAPSFNSYS